jgi:C-terminal processing protease CtpA/Prc
MQDLRNGPAGEPVALGLRPPQGPAYTVTLTRQPADDFPLRGPGLREWRLERLAELKPGVLYLDADRLTAADLETVLLPRLAKAKAVVIDVRGYPSIPMELLGLFADKPLVSERYQLPVTRFPDRRGVTAAGEPWRLDPQQPHLTAKLALLSDGRAVSYAETFLALAARGRLGPIVGGPTSGTNGPVNLYVLPGGYRFSFTNGMTHKLDGGRHHGVGVLPTAPVSRTLKAIAEGRDEVIEKALELLGV